MNGLQNDGKPTHEITYLTVADAAKLLDCSHGTIRNLERRGEIPCVRASGSIRLFALIDLIRYKVQRESK